MAKSSADRAPRNRTLTLSPDERHQYEVRLLRLDGPALLDDVIGRTICQDVVGALPLLPPASVDLLIADPPYNMNKKFNEASFAMMPLSEYEVWLDSWISQLPRILKPNGSIYICGDWRSSGAIHRVCEKYFLVRNRI